MPGHNTLSELEESFKFQEIPDPGDAAAIQAKTGVCNMKSAGAETRTLAAPASAGLFLLLNFQSDGGTITLTCSDTFNGTDDNTIEFADEGDAVILISLPQGSGTTTYQWCLFDGTGGPAVSTV